MKHLTNIKFYQDRVSFVYRDRDYTIEYRSQDKFTVYLGGLENVVINIKKKCITVSVRARTKETLFGRKEYVYKERPKFVKRNLPSWF